jgi:hypothetical protein
VTEFFGPRPIIQKHRQIRAVAVLIILMIFGGMYYMMQPPSRAQIQVEGEAYEKDLLERWHSIPIEIKPAGSGLNIDFVPHSSFITWTITGDTSRYSGFTIKTFHGDKPGSSVVFNIKDTSCRGHFDPDLTTRVEVTFDPKR